MRPTRNLPATPCNLRGFVAAGGMFLCGVGTCVTMVQAL